MSRLKLTAAGVGTFLFVAAFRRETGQTPASYFRP